ncbi:hypothetical protein NQ317_014403 [Molorchus minor]|uniref:PurE domain-containing protein n=1 Tax=Molorchus minor TaxID=1323400 RepID=A0ABQ9K561_9CUCU|nr:hypothetical protein NQ317_014403 [Molorchus minor]
MGSPTDKEHCNKIKKHCEDLGLNVEIRVTSAHKTTENTLEMISYYEGLKLPIVFIAVAGRSNGLGPVISGNTDFPVVNCPPGSKDDLSRDVWSSLNVPSGLGCTTRLRLTVKPSPHGGNPDFHFRDESNFVAFS